MGALRYTAQNTGQIPSTPVRIFESPEAEAAKGLERGVESIGRGAIGLGQMGRVIEEQTSRMELYKMKGLHDGMMAQAQLDTENDPEVRKDPKLYESVYATKVQDYNQKVLDSATTDNIRGAFQMYLDGTMPELAVKAQAHGFKLQALKWKGDLEAVGTSTAALAGESDPVTRNSYVKEWNRMIDDGEASGFLKPYEAEKAKHDYAQKVLSSNFRFWLSTDKEAFNEFKRAGAWNDLDTPTKTKLLNEDFAAQKATEKQLDLDREKAVKEYRNNWMAEANFGRVSQDRIDRGKAGLDPVDKDAKWWAELEQVNNKAPNKVGNPQVQALETSYFYGSPSIDLNARRAWVEKHIKMANELGMQLGAGNEKLMQFQKYLLGQQQSLISAERAETNQARTLENAAVSQGETSFERKFKSQIVEPAYGGRKAQQIQAADDKRDLNAGLEHVRQQIRINKTNPDEAAQEAINAIMKARDEENSRIRENAAKNKAKKANELYPSTVPAPGTQKPGG